MDDIQTMTDVAMWSLVVGFFSPLVIAAVEQPGWSNRARSLVAFAYCVVVGVITAWLNGALEGRAIVSSILLVLVSAISTYKNLWKQTGATQAIETATSRGGHTA